MNEDFTPFELAVKLREKGLDEPCYGYYHCNGGNDSFELCGNGDRDFLNSKNKHRIAAPTIPQVLKWLREEKKIFIEIALSPEGYRHIIYTGLYCMDTPCAFHFSFDGFYNLEDNYRTYEQATLAGIGYVLDNLI
jgi:hypothetical protein